MSPADTFTPRRHWAAAWPGLLVWAGAWAVMYGLDSHLDIASLALILVLASALAALSLPPLLSVLGCAAAVLAFNWVFVPPRGSFTVNLHQHALLLATMLTVSWIVVGLMARQRSLAAREREHALQAEQLRSMGDALRDADDPADRAPQLQAALRMLVGAPATLLMLKGALPMADDLQASTRLGDATADGWAGLWLCLRQSTAFGPGTGRHEEQGAWFLPMRGRTASVGAAMLPVPTPDGPMADDVAAIRTHAQALCDQMGLALERAAALRSAESAREEAQSQALRNTLLAAISHDYRTPLATILGAASSLQEQGQRLAPEQRQRLAATIVDEADQLARLTDNTLQLARLEAPGLALQLDWESAEEIVGSVLRRTRARDPRRRLRVRLEPGLPLLRCDAVLLVQLLDNLVDNALKHGGEETPVEIVVRRVADQVVLAVQDRGPGVAPAWRKRVFDVFQRGAPQAQGPARRGAGVGLAVCRVIARAHGGELSVRERQHGGASFECTLPVAPPPALPAVEGPL